MFVSFRIISFYITIVGYPLKLLCYGSKIKILEDKKIIHKLILRFTKFKQNISNRLIQSKAGKSYSLQAIRPCFILDLEKSSCG